VTEPRRAKIERKTKESDIVVELNLDGTGVVDVDTGVPFFDHMLTSLGSHASLDLTVQAKGDIEIEGHHTIEDTAIVLGQALGKALARRSATMARRLVGSSARRVDAECVAVMLTSRPGGGDADGWDRIVNDEIRCCTIDLGAVSEQQVGEWANRIGIGLTGAQAARLHRRASALRQDAASRTVAGAAHVEHA
jgi:hypothetical protein